MASWSENLPEELLGGNFIERQRFLASFDIVMVDCDGCIWTLLGPIEGAGEGLRALERANKEIIYVSNNSVRSVENYRRQLEKAGLELQEHNLVTSAISIVDYLKTSHFQGKIYVIGGRELRNLLQNEGFDIIYGPDEPIDESFVELLNATVADGQAVKAVIFDVDMNYNYIKYLRAQSYLNRDPECLLILGSTDRTRTLANGATFAGPGPFIDMLKSARPSVELGKPGLTLGQLLMEKFKVTDPRRVLFIGDTLEQDILFGKNCGFQTLLVLTGATSKEDLLRPSDDHHRLIPDYFTDSLFDFVKLLSDGIELESIELANSPE